MPPIGAGPIRGDDWCMVQLPIREDQRPALDRVLELFERRELSPTELRMLVALSDREASLSELAGRLGQRPAEIRRAARSMSTRGLVRWYHAGKRKETRLEITARGLITVRALLTAFGPTGDEAERPAAE
jgi:DNA-binding MarR family transcriptional regulator